MCNIYLGDILAINGKKRMNTFEIIVGNIGNVFIGEHENNARKCFNECVELSKNKYGRWANEPVTLMRNGEPIKEHNP